jgi:hypothetical protein
MTMMHEPGPWRLVDEPRNERYTDAGPGDYKYEMQHCQVIETREPVLNFDLEGSRRFVADVITSRNKIGSANAVMLAAAPELFESLRNLVDYCDSGVRNDDHIATAKRLIARLGGSDE